MIARIKPGREIHSGMNLELDLSFDSLERVELLANVQEAFRFRIAPEQAASIFTVGDVLALARDRTALQTDWAEWRDILREPLSDTEQAMADRYLGARPLAAPLFFAATKTFCLIAKLLLRYRFRSRATVAGPRPLHPLRESSKLSRLPADCRHAAVSRLPPDVQSEYQQVGAKRLPILVRTHGTRGADRRGSQSAHGAPARRRRSAARHGAVRFSGRPSFDERGAAALP